MKQEYLKLIPLVALLAIVTACGSKTRANSHNVKEYLAAVAPQISELEFADMGDVLAACEGKKQADQQTFNDDYLSLTFGANEDTRFIECRAWPLDEGMTLVAVNFFQYGETPKIKFFEVNDADMNAKEVAVPFKPDTPGKTPSFLYQLSADTPDVKMYSYECYDDNGDIIMWRAKWNGKGFDLSIDDSANEPTGEIGPFEGRYQQTNLGNREVLVTVSIEGNTINVSRGGLNDMEFFATGEISNAKLSGDKATFDCYLSLDEDVTQAKSNKAAVTITKQPDGLYAMKFNFSDGRDNRLRSLDGTLDLYKLKGSSAMLDGEVPTSIYSEKLTIKGLLQALSVYKFCPEVFAMVEDFRKPGHLAETEQVVVDERNRFGRYSWGDADIAMECKYWRTADGNVLLILDRHDPTYSSPQELSFYVFDVKKNSLRQIDTAFSDDWPIGRQAVEKGIAYQVRYNTDHVVALVPETDGESCDIRYLKFDGKQFK